MSELIFPRLLTGPEVNVGWRHFVATAPHRLRMAPGVYSPVVHSEAGDPIQIDDGDHVGWQSLPNPRRLAYPPARPPARDRYGALWAWVYKRDGGHAGFARVEFLAEHPPVPGHPLRGPAQLDFEVGYKTSDYEFMRPTYREPQRFPYPDAAGIRQVTGTVYSLHARSHPDGTSYYYLRAHDRIATEKRSHEKGYVGGRVLSAAGIPRGERVWFLAKYAPLV